MSEIVIQAEKLCKRYRIGQREPYKALRDSLSGAIYAPFHAAATKLRKKSASNSGDFSKQSTVDRTQSDTIWALDDVSFEVKQGQVVGIIGRNGAGKSTLLKVLSRITEPTRGMVDIWGRVGSLLEVGTGFHPELTGRENVYLNGAILGMRRDEIACKFDEIVEFAEIEKFIDTPVKFYSTGMYLRLAFSVAAHLEPDILLIDEILAVGDAAFQKKCLGKMGDVAHQGRTVLFVSHQMNAIRELCPSCMWLDRGKLVDQGETNRIVAKYLSHGLTKSEWTAQDGKSTVNNPYFNPLRFCIVNKHLEPVLQDVRADEDFGILLEGNAAKLNSALTVGFAIYAPSGELMFWSLHTDVAEQDWPKIDIGNNRLVAWVPPHLLNEGDYRIEMIISLHFKEWISQPGVNAPSIGLSMRGGLSQSPHWIMARPGPMAPVIQFEKIGSG